MTRRLVLGPRRLPPWDERRGIRHPGCTDSPAGFLESRALTGPPSISADLLASAAEWKEV
jgi:hypothetical protein